MGRKRSQPGGAEGMASDPADDRRFVAALARGLGLLRCFRPQDRWLAHQELARRSGLPQATVSRLTFTLVSLGYLRHRAERGEYALAPAVLALGFSVLTNFEIGRIARPHPRQIPARHEQRKLPRGRSGAVGQFRWQRQQPAQIGWIAHGVLHRLLPRCISRPESGADNGPWHG